MAYTSRMAISIFNITCGYRGYRRAWLYTKGKYIHYTHLLHIIMLKVYPTTIIAYNNIGSFARKWFSSNSQWHITLLSGNLTSK